MSGENSGDTFRIGYDDIFREENDDNFVDKQAKDIASDPEHNYTNDISFDNVWDKFKFHDIHIKRT